jgi:hypothetical protein
VLVAGGHGRREVNMPYGDIIYRQWRVCIAHVCPLNPIAWARFGFGFGFGLPRPSAPAPTPFPIPGGPWDLVWRWSVSPEVPVPGGIFVYSI